MFATSTRGPLWPARLSFFATGLFTLASGGTNLFYGIAKGTDAASSLVWAAVSVGVSIVFALSWPAFIVSLDRRQWARAGLVLTALLVTGSYSVSAALGSAMGGRANAAVEERTMSDNRARAQATYDAAKNELASLKPARPVTELEALVAAARPQCRIVVTLNRRDSVCSPPPSLIAELGRAKRRAELEARIERAAGELANTTPAKIANSDAVALASYLQGLGIDTTADRINKLLVLLAVLVIECGGGLALSDHGPLAGEVRGAGRLPGTLPAPPAITPLPAHAANTGLVEPTALAGTLPSMPGSGARERLLGMLHGGQGVVRGCQAEIGRAIGVSRSRVRQLLSELAAAGTIRVRTSSTGTVISLVGSIEARASVH